MDTKTLVYKYALKNIQGYDDGCESELIRMNALWNKLVETDRQREADFRALCCDLSLAYASAAAELEELAPQIDALFEAIRAERVKLRSKEPSDELKARKEALLGRRKGLWECQKDAQKALPKEAFKPINEAFKARVKAARQSSGCYWPNYNAVILSFETARQKALKDGGRLHFKRFDGAGRFVNQIQGGITLSGLLGGESSQVQLGAVEATKRQGKEYRPFSFTAYTGKTEDGKHLRKNINATIVLHRPLPDNAVVKSVEAVKAVTDGKAKWHVCLTVQTPADTAPHPLGNLAGVNLGWRQIGSQIRVAYLVDDKGNRKEYLLPAKIVHKFAQAEALQTQADESRNDMLAWLRPLYQRFAENPAVQGGDVEQKCRSKCGALKNSRTAQDVERRFRGIPVPSGRGGHQYVIPDGEQELKESMRLLLRTSKPSINLEDLLLDVWRGTETAKDGFAQYQEWHKANKRLHRSYTGCRRNAVKARDYLYQCWAKDMAENYAMLAVSDMATSQMGRVKDKAGLGVDNELPEAARRNRVIASPYSLQEWMKKQADKRGGVFEKVTGKVTQTCHRCGHLNTGIGAKLDYLCGGCGTEHDTDANAATNCRQWAVGEKPAKQVKLTKYARVKAVMAEKAQENLQVG